MVKSQAKDYRAYLTGYKSSLEQLNTDRAMLLGTFTTANAPDNILDKINRDYEAWKAEWGMNGQKYKAMRIAHQKEINAFFEKVGG